MVRQIHPRTILDDIVNRVNMLLQECHVDMFRRRIHRRCVLLLAAAVAAVGVFVVIFATSIDDDANIMDSRTIDLHDIFVFVVVVVIIVLFVRCLSIHNVEGCA